MATTFYLYNGGSGVSGYDGASVNPGPDVMSTIVVVDTGASGTDIQWTKTSGGAPLSWATRPLSAAVTISGTVTVNVWGVESTVAANAGVRFKLFRLQPNGTKTLFGTLDRGVELTNAMTAQNYTGTPSSQAFAIGDRIVMEPYITNVGVMAGALTCSMRYARGSPGISGDSYITFTETIAVSSSSTVS